MTAKPVKVAWVSDSAALRSDIKGVGTAMDGAAAQAVTAGQKIDGAFDSTAEHADTVASKGSQAAGALSGLGDLVGGKFGAAMVVGGTAMQGFADAGDLVNVVTESAIIRKIKDTAVTIGQTAATVAHTAATKTVRAATKAWTIAQLALNAVLSANPLGLVVLAVAALVAAIVIAYKKSDTFREIVHKAFEVVGGIADDVLGKFQTVVEFIGGVPGKVSALAGKFKQAGLDVMGGLVDGIKGVPGFLGSVAGSVANVAIGLLNSVIDKVNGALDFTIPVPGLPDIHVNAPNIPHIPALASGGIVTRPTFALIGEAGPEAVIPLGRGIGNVINVKVLVPPTANPVATGREIKRVLDAYLHNGGH